MLLKIFVTVGFVNIVAGSVIHAGNMKLPELDKRDVCSLQSNISTSSQPGSCLSPGIVSNCDRWDTVVQGNTCNDYLFHGITEQDLNTWNTQINAGCTNLQPDTWICTGANGTGPVPPCNTCPAGSVVTPGVGMVAPGTTVPCSCYYLVQPGDYCDSVSAKFGITSAELEQWNLSAGGPGCPTLPANQYICVALPSS